jgi:Tfp pilus assembly protein PilF
MTHKSKKSLPEATGKESSRGRGRPERLDGGTSGQVPHTRQREPGAGAAAARAALAVFVVAFALYANTLGHDFVWDDRDLIVDNARVRTLDGQAVRSMFLEDFWRTSQRGGGYYRPLVTLTYHVQYRVFDGNPAGFHFANVLWNALACALLFVFVFLLFRNVAFGVAAALLFAVHPVHTENVAWIAGRTDLLAAMWSFASLTCYVLARRRRSVPWLAAALIAFALALLAKESAAFIPLVVVLLELEPLRGELGRSGKRHLGPSLYFGVLVVYLLLRYNAIGTGVSTYDPYAPGALGKVALPLSIFAGYVAKLIFPLQLSGEYDAPVPDSFFTWHVIAGAVVLLAILFAVWRYRRQPDVVLGAGMFLLGLGPVSNVIPLGEVSAERFLYLPSAGFAIVLGGIAARAAAARYVRLRALAKHGFGAHGAMKPSLAGNVLLVITLVAIAFAVRTFARNMDWKSEEVLFAKTAEASPSSARARLNLGNVNRRDGRIAAAIDAYQQALEIDPDYPDALSNLAGIFVQQGRHDEAMRLIEHALKTAPDDVTLLSNLGMLYFQKRRFAEAAERLERAVELDPMQLNAHYNLGLIRLQERNRDEAAGHFERVAGKGPAYNRAYFYLAVIESERGKREEAKRYARQFLSVYRQNDSMRAQALSIAEGAEPR